LKVMMVWHYSAWARLPDIVESGELRGSNAWAAGELPMLWFSANQQWEPTATKLYTSDSGVTVSLTFQQQADNFGCIRFGMAANDMRLLNWKAACTTAGTRRDTRRTLEKIGKKKGGDPSQWFATASAIPLSELHFQVWLNNAWNDATSPRDMAKVWEQHSKS
jgi:hypothetical protein